jgi:methylated-DNA-protein-cysteine methyltransferase-like protein
VISIDNKFYFINMHLKHSTALNEHSDEIDHLTKNNDHMDSFLTQIYTVILQIPKGKVATYGDIAKMAGYPGYARQVGKALSNLPESSKLPWFRVINSRGIISLTGADFTRQRAHLIEDGIHVSDHGKIALKTYRWTL